MIGYRSTLIVIILCMSILSRSQEIMIMDKSDGNKIVNDLTITAYSTDTSIVDLTKPFGMLNNTDSVLRVYLRKVIHTIADSTIDYFCFGPKCWPDSDTTDMPAVLEPGVVNFSFASHVVHERRFDFPPLPPGLTSITYVIFDDSTFSESIEAKVTVNYHLSPVKIAEFNKEVKSVFPNPASDRLSIQTHQTNNGNFKLIIYNMKGEIVKDRRINIVDGHSKFSVSELTSGSYFGRVFIENGRSIYFRFLVQ